MRAHCRAPFPCRAIAPAVLWMANAPLSEEPRCLRVSLAGGAATGSHGNHFGRSRFVYSGNGQFGWDMMARAWGASTTQGPPRGGDPSTARRTRNPFPYCIFEGVSSVQGTVTATPPRMKVTPASEIPTRSISARFHRGRGLAMFASQVPFFCGF